MYFYPVNSNEIRNVQFQIGTETGNNTIKNVRWLFRFSNLTCLNCYQMPINRSDSVSLRIKHVVISFLAILSIFVINISNIIINIDFGMTKSIIVNRGFALTLLMAAVASSSFIISDMCNRKKIWQILFKIHDFDQEVSSLSIFMAFEKYEFHLI